MRHRSKMYGTIIASTLFMLALGLGGCVRTGRGIQVVPQSSSRGVLDLSADDIVAIMRTAGFSDEQIVEHGTAVHDGLAQSGAVQIKTNRKVEVIFAVNGEDVYIITRLRGIFIYNVNTGTISNEESR